MKLEWYRQHKKFVYWVLLPVVGGGMAFFGLGSALRSGIFSKRLGPSISYTVAGKQFVMDSGEVQSQRLLLARFYPHSRNASSDDVAVHLIKYQLALAGGFEYGNEALHSRLREMVKWQVQQREGAAVEPTPEIYDKLIEQMQITRKQFEILTREIVVGAEYQQFITYSPVNDSELFIAYNHAKELARLRYKEIKSADFMAQAASPTEEQITKFYNENKGKAEALELYKDILFNKPKMSADLLYYDAAKLVLPAPTDEELKVCYERYKSSEWKIAPKEGEPPLPPNTPETFKPFVDVKADVEQKWIKDQKKSKLREKMEALTAELTVAEKAFNAAQASKAAADRKIFDIAEWAKKKDLIHWSTPEQTEEQYSKGKNEIGASDAGWIKNIFSFAKPLDMRAGGDPRQIQSFNARYKRMFEEFSFPMPVDPANPEKGCITYRKKKYIADEIKPLAIAHDAIAIHLKICNAIDLAKKEAENLREKWLKDGLDRATIETLSEITVDANNSHALGIEFFDSPKAIGEMLAIAQGRAEIGKPGDKSEHVCFFVGFAVERKLPTWTTFHHDLAWDRDSKRKELADSQRAFLEAAWRRNINYTKPVGVKDAPLFEQYRAPVDDDF